jgi:hypothetical protein
MDSTTAAATTNPPVHPPETDVIPNGDSETSPAAPTPPVVDFVPAGASSSNEHESPHPPPATEQDTSRRCLQHGSYSLIPIWMSTMAWFACYLQDGCDYSKVTGEIVGKLSLDPRTPFVEVGLAAYRTPTFNEDTETWATKYNGQCLQYPEQYVDTNTTAWNMARLFDFFSIVLGGGSTFFLWFSACCVFSKATWRCAGYEILLALVFQLLSFCWFANSMCHDGDNHCALFYGS